MFKNSLFSYNKLALFKFTKKVVFQTSLMAKVNKQYFTQYFTLFMICGKIVDFSQLFHEILGRTKNWNWRQKCLKWRGSGQCWTCLMIQFRVDNMRSEDLTQCDLQCTHLHVYSEVIWGTGLDAHSWLSLWALSVHTHSTLLQLAPHLWYMEAWQGRGAHAYMHTDGCVNVCVLERDLLTTWLPSDQNTVFHCFHL